MDRIAFTEEVPDKQEFFYLFATSGWNKEYRLSSDELHRAVAGSWYVVSGYDQDRLVGFGRVICDGVVHALILDLIVHPEYRNQGLGRTILGKLVDRCRENRIRDIQLFSVKGKAGFYRKSGFRERPPDAPGMEIKLLQNWEP